MARSKFIGDAVLAALAFRRQEDDTDRAVRAALAMRHATSIRMTPSGVQLVCRLLNRGPVL
jgi:class 3 adenylate cyclase